MERNVQVTDEVLMQKLSNDELDCSAILFQRWHQHLYNFFLRLTANTAQSEDLTQGVFERIIRYRRSYRSGCTFKSWMYQIARNLLADQRKKSAFFRDQFVQTDQLADQLPDVNSDSQKLDQYRQLEKALTQLAEDQREILVLTRFQQLKYREVAEILDISEAAVKVKVHRALIKLRSIYFKMEEA